MLHKVSSYRLGDAFYSKLYDEDIQDLLREHPNTIGAEYLQASKKEENKCIDTITRIVKKHLEKYRHLLPENIENSTVIHLRLGDVVAGNTWHEKLKRPFDVNFYKGIIPNQKTYIIGKPFFAKTSSLNFEESIKSSKDYIETLIKELNVEHFDGGHADIDLCCAVACECFVQGKGFFSDLIVEIRKKLNKKNIETTFKQSMKSKKVALISTFCDTQEKIDVLSKNIDNVRVFGLDVVVISPIVLPEKIQKKCDYYFQTKDNPILEWPIKGMFFWKDLVLADKMVKITRTITDYGWAGLMQIKTLSEIAISLNYDYYYHMIYDLKFDETVADGLLSEAEANIYSSRRGDTIWDVGLHFMVFNHEKLKRFISYINLESYLRLTSGDAFVWLYNLKDILPYNIVNSPVEDEIFYYDGKDFFDSSPIQGIKIFIDKNDEEDSTIKLLFFGIEETKTIILNVANTSQEYTINGNSLIDLKFKKDNISNVSIDYNGVNYDMTTQIKKIKHNTLKEIQ